MSESEKDNFKFEASSKVVGRLEIHYNANFINKENGNHASMIIDQLEQLGYHINKFESLGNNKIPLGIVVYLALPKNSNYQSEYVEGAENLIKKINKGIISKSSASISVL